MAPTALFQDLAKRYYYNSDCYYYGNCQSGWYRWGRWVVAGIIILAFIVSLLLLARINSRRRRLRGQHPMYGTGWMAPGINVHNKPNAYQQPPPQYSATSPPYQPQQQAYPMDNYNNNNNQGYYGGQTEGVAPPQNTYYPPGQRGGDDVYSAPPGPPPGK
ncbi:hypothetical protein DL546_003406 [Coniochaeta pulveracea]|uniref:Uncharacterized protein n=1 Tax=Coniochaeta pulveracea TaxID=177199 RepID=A0A420XY99_9PEZI|nr:hypothetical protein DL546_003406 [Coniochaeta pulveracea]